MEGGKKIKGRELGEGKENKMETSTPSVLSRQRSGYHERGSPESRKERWVFNFSSLTNPSGRLEFQISFRGGNLSSYTGTLLKGKWLGFRTPPVRQAGNTDVVSGIHSKRRETDMALGFKEMTVFIGKLPCCT